MKRMWNAGLCLLALATLIASQICCFAPTYGQAQDHNQEDDGFGHPVIGREVSIPVHLHDGQEYELSTEQLIAFGEKLFTARWTSQEGAGRAAL